jgi:hypothetical protein
MTKAAKSARLSRKERNEAFFKLADAEATIEEAQRLLVATRRAHQRSRKKHTIAN